MGIIRKSKEDSRCQTAGIAGDRYRSISAEFLISPQKYFLGAEVDALGKMISVLPWLAESDVALEELGFSGNRMQHLVSVNAFFTAFPFDQRIFTSRATVVSSIAPTRMRRFRLTLALLSDVEVAQFIDHQQAAALVEDDPFR